MEILSEYLFVVPKVDMTRFVNPQERPASEATDVDAAQEDV